MGPDNSPYIEERVSLAAEDALTSDGIKLTAD